MREIWWDAHICARELKAGTWFLALGIKHLPTIRIPLIWRDNRRSICMAVLREQKVEFNLEIDVKAHRVYVCVSACVRVHIHQRSGSLQEPPAELPPQWMRSYCGFGAPRAIRWVYGKHEEAESLVILSGLISLSLSSPTSLVCQGWTHTTVVHLRWGEPYCLFNFYFPLLYFCC